MNDEGVGGGATRLEGHHPYMSGYPDARRRANTGSLILKAVYGPPVSAWCLVRAIQCAHDQKPRARNQKTEINDNCYCSNVYSGSEPK